MRKGEIDPEGLRCVCERHEKQKKAPPNRTQTRQKKSLRSDAVEDEKSLFFTGVVEAKNHRKSKLSRRRGGRGKGNEVSRVADQCRT